MDLRKGPNAADGKPERLTVNTTPVPLALEVPDTKPRMLVVLLLGRVAVYVTPAGLFCVTAASPSLPVVPGMMGPEMEPTWAWLRRARGRMERRVEACILDGVI